MNNKGYTVFNEAVDSNGVNIVGIRNNIARANSFDDAIVRFLAQPGDQQLGIPEI